VRLRTGLGTTSVHRPRLPRDGHLRHFDINRH